MLKVLLLFVLLIAGIVVGPMIAGHQGYVLIQTDNYNIETSVTGLAIILILAMVVLFAIEWLLRRIFRTGAHTRGWFVGRKRRRARKQTEQALLKLAEGDYQQVEKLMAKNADHAEQPVVNYLLAAEAAQQRGDEARANQHLERAAELAGNGIVSTGYYTVDYWSSVSVWRNSPGNWAGKTLRSPITLTTMRFYGHYNNSHNRKP